MSAPATPPENETPEAPGADGGESGGSGPDRTAGTATPESSARGKGGSASGIEEIRRRDRSRNDAWIREFLRRAPWGFLATVSDGQPFLNSNLFVYVEKEHCIYLHTARTGRTPRNLEDPGQVAFSAAVLGRLLPADEALEFSAEYGGVVTFGRARRLEDEDEKRTVLQLMLDKYAPHLQPGRDYRPITQAELRRTAVYRVDIDAWSGKEKVAPPEFPGAFRVERPSIPLRSSDSPDEHA